MTLGSPPVRWPLRAVCWPLHRCQRLGESVALAGWAVWLVTFVFAITASIGFASVNISDVTASRASRVTPAVTVAQAPLADAMAARDRECRGGVGKFCREREAAVAERRQAVEAAMRGVEPTAAPQTQAAIRLTTWASLGTLRPTENDFSMLRLMLLALLPQLGGVSASARPSTGPQRGDAEVRAEVSHSRQVRHRLNPLRLLAFLNFRAAPCLMHDAGFPVFPGPVR